MRALGDFSSNSQLRNTDSPQEPSNDCNQAVSALLNMQQDIGPVALSIDRGQQGSSQRSQVHFASYTQNPEIAAPPQLELDPSLPSPDRYSSLDRSLLLSGGASSHHTGREAEISHSALTTSALSDLATAHQGPADSWGLNINSQVPGWLVNDDFDLTALNSSIMASVQGQLPQYSGIVSEPTPAITIDQTIEYASRASEHKEDVVRRHWLTYFATDGSGLTTPNVPEQTQVDEAYRECLSRQLQQRIQNDPLPSTDFLASASSHWSQIYTNFQRIYA